MNHYLLIDGNSLLFRAQHGRKLMVGEQETTAIIGFLKTLHYNCATKFPGGIPIVLWDSPSNWRKAENVEYKANRDVDEKAISMKDAVKPQRLPLTKLLATLGVIQMQARGFEADDLGGLLAAKLAALPGAKVTMITSDMDWLQLVRDNVEWYCPRKEHLINAFDFSMETGLDSQEAFLIAKALQGDTSDNLKGVGGIGHKAALMIANRFGEDGAENLIDQMAVFLEDNNGEVPKGDDLRRFNKKVRDFVLKPEGRAIFKCNMKMMDLIRPREGLATSVNSIRHPYDEVQFKRLLQQFAFQSILRNYDQWVAPFTAQR